MNDRHSGSGPASSGLSEIKQGLAACLTVLGVLFVAIIASAGVAPALLPAEALSSGPNGQPSNLFNWISLLAFQAFASILIVLVVAFQMPQRTLFTLALTPPQASAGVVLTTFVVSTLALAAVSAFSVAFFAEDVMRDLRLFQNLLADSPAIIPILALTVGAPISEELLFRGFLLNRLSHTRLGFARAAVVSSFGWTLLHVGYSTIGLIEVFLAGLVFSWALWRTGSLWVPIAFHAIYNGIVLMVLRSTPLPAGV